MPHFIASGLAIKIENFPRELCPSEFSAPSILNTVLKLRAEKNGKDSDLRNGYRKFRLILTRAKLWTEIRPELNSKFSAAATFSRFVGKSEIKVKIITVKTTV